MLSDDLDAVLVELLVLVIVRRVLGPDDDALVMEFIDVTDDVDDEELLDCFSIRLELDDDGLDFDGTFGMAKKLEDPEPIYK